MNTAQSNQLREERLSQGPPEAPVVKSATRARQGVTGHGVRYVLGWGLAAVVVAFVIAYILIAGGR